MQLKGNSNLQTPQNSNQCHYHLLLFPSPKLVYSVDYCPENKAESNPYTGEQRF